MMLRIHLLKEANCIDFSQFALLKMTELLDQQETLRVHLNNISRADAFDAENADVQMLGKLVEGMNLHADSNNEMSKSIGKRAQALFNHRRIYDGETDASDVGGPLHQLMQTSLKHSSDYDWEHYSAKKDDSQEPQPHGDH